MAHSAHHSTYHSEAARIGVVIPALNEERLLSRLLEQFTPERQRRFGLEIIVSDGGSSDGTSAIAEAALDRSLVTRLVRWREERRQTIAEGRNVGANASSAPILVFLNADTLPRNADEFFASVEAWAANASSSPAAATPVHIAPDERIWSDVIFHFLMNSYVRLLNYIGVGMGRGECHIIRRKDFYAVGGYDASIVAGEDFDLYVKLRKRGRVHWLPQATVYESPRRFRKYGYMRIIWRWLLNSVSVLILRRSVSSEWELIRE
jgi:glycosyltransferase involved in cell wall biosynthesis